ncbi:MAG: glycosyltransferase [Gammaproteobacteria bacterium]|nr:glycosyltransferase [Gammaproteobacteria bacterium]
MNEIPINLSAWPGAMEIALPPDLPSISVVTPNFNHGKTLERTLRSVLGQRYPGLQYVVVDDASTDDSPQILDAFEGEIDVIRSPERRGQYVSINEGMSRCRGDILAWLNSDDIYLPWTLALVAHIFSRHPDIQWITGIPTVMQGGAIVAVGRCRPWPRRLIRAGLCDQRHLPMVQQESTFWRRGLWETAGGLDTRIDFAGDYELWTRFAREAELVTVQAILGGFSFYGTNRSIVGRETYQQEMRRVQSAMDADDQRLRRRMDQLHWLGRLVDRKARLPRLFGVDLSGPVLRRCLEKNAFQLERHWYPLNRAQG